MDTMRWEDGALLLLDQTKLPEKTEYLRCTRPEEVAAAIRRLAVRGAPAIGIAAAYGLALGAREFKGTEREEFLRHLRAVKELLAGTRPTAVNLFQALERAYRRAEELADESVAAMQQALLDAAHHLFAEDMEICRRIGAHGAAVVPPGARILTHCNAGALATAGYGTALGVIRAAHAAGKVAMVYADETRPLLQGARLTAYELQEDGIPVTLICDDMAGYAMQKGRVDLVIFGADRIAANGDTANKIGSYSVAVLAREHGIPVYVAAPLATIDERLTSGREIPIEERDPEEVTHIGGRRLARAGVSVWNPAFDVTPHWYLSGIITEAGILRPPFKEAIQKALAAPKGE
ncbi:MAG TPA: S-methyl-5-thioribose-1-phosphate isomerase [Firmicutes bacterium]|jgi:methylthioribose-1-phosphate isomerase|nr:S-methyl-5-thioribose-1-phosphate isomerase [Bacillota bacterium]